MDTARDSSANNNSQSSRTGKADGVAVVTSAAEATVISLQARRSLQALWVQVVHHNEPEAASVSSLRALAALPPDEDPSYLLDDDEWSTGEEKAIEAPIEVVE
ncbi:hypothetical protein K7X08_032347 [Anisodus acutangulus]|uniref:Uncharacterized protein n=1 Tax=Anisodus acutangulus TaxID=402998 RepID=A0A9Q1RBB1_9SOLA|nr:hypothetical protein K7X08_032347 [Anisodus acutangulus]